MKRLAAVVLFTAACGGGSLSPADKAARCSAFADLVVKAGLPATPDERRAREVADSLDNSLSRLTTPALHSPAVEAHRSLHAVEVAQRQGRTADAQEAAGRATQALRELAEACALPETRFLAAP